VSFFWFIYYFIGGLHPYYSHALTSLIWSPQRRYNINTSFESAWRLKHRVPYCMQCVRVRIMCSVWNGGEWKFFATVLNCLLQFVTPICLVHTSSAFVYGWLFGTRVSVESKYLIFQPSGVFIPAPRFTAKA